MKTRKECEALAKEALQNFVNSCECECEDDVMLAISCMLGMGIEAGETLKDCLAGKGTITRLDG